MKHFSLLLVVGVILLAVAMAYEVARRRAKHGKFQFSIRGLLTLVTLISAKILAFDPATGEELWSCDGIARLCIIMRGLFLHGGEPDTDLLLRLSDVCRSEAGGFAE
ncbi:hypothetical protein [Novipirellula artificiosorum]|uniref:Uncharacterized protein n=1 Tax=Novipirellula artificiosorum TaxID=2528016 RepID=A0A5C6DWP1_9BACT|nr:hypothetical protein [Novipirellula artificiosorum]TWU39219.1 hypothetical protein Poly41_20410 [Novipirellula artificiosorum]